MFVKFTENFSKEQQKTRGHVLFNLEKIVGEIGKISANIQ